MFRWRVWIRRLRCGTWINKRSRAFAVPTTILFWTSVSIVKKLPLVLLFFFLHHVLFVKNVAPHVFAAVSTDGILRSFDTRALNSSGQVLFQRPCARPLVQLRWNRADTNYVSVLLDQPSSNPEHDVMVVDVRKPRPSVVSYERKRTNERCSKKKD